MICITDKNVIEISCEDLQNAHIVPSFWASIVPDLNEYARKKLGINLWSVDYKNIDGHVTLTLPKYSVTWHTSFVADGLRKIFGMEVGCTAKIAHHFRSIKKYVTIQKECIVMHEPQIVRRDALNRVYPVNQTLYRGTVIARTGDQRTKFE